MATTIASAPEKPKPPLKALRPISCCRSPVACLLFPILALTLFVACDRVVEGPCQRYAARTRAVLASCQAHMRALPAALPAREVASAAGLVRALAHDIGSDLEQLRAIHATPAALAVAHEQLIGAVQAVYTELVALDTSYTALSQTPAGPTEQEGVRAGLERLGAKLASYAQSGRRFEASCAR